MSEGDPNRDPRPNRFIRHFLQKNNVHVLSDYPVDIPDVTSFSFAGEQKGEGSSSGSKKNLDYVKKPARLMLGLIQVYWFVFCSILGIESIFYLGKKCLVRQLARNRYDLIISHDLTLLPLAFSLKGPDTRIILDAREYHPLNYQDQWFWRLEKKPLLLLLCKKYLIRCDLILTISRGIAKRYRQDWGVDPVIFMSLPDSHQISPEKPKESIRLIHHGWPSRSRQIELMILMMDYVDERFSLDLMLLPGNDSYWDQLTMLATARENVRIIPPVTMEDIIPTIKKYDIGVFIVPPTNFNLKYTLPNKLFEFIQARLAIAIGPSPEMEEIVQKYRCGLVSPDFSPQAMAHILNGQTSESIYRLKLNADVAAKELNNEENFIHLESVMAPLWAGSNSGEVNV